MKKLIALLLALVLVVGMFAGCGKTEAEVNPEQAQPEATEGAEAAPTEEQAPPAEEAGESETPLVIQWDQNNGTDVIEPPYVASSLSYHTRMIWSQIYEENDAYQRTDPEFYAWDLGTSIVANEDNTEYVVTIREDAVWSDGEPVTADDVAFSVMVNILDPVSTAAKPFNKVVGFEALTNGEAETLEGMSVEGNTITFKLVEPNANFAPNLFVLPAHCFEGLAWAEISTADYWKNPVTSGPYVVAETSFPDYMKLTRNDNYYGLAAGIKNITCVSYETAGSDAAVAAMITGEADITTRTVTSSGVIANEIADANPDCVIKTMHSDLVRGFVFNMGNRSDGNNKDVLVNDANARLAISLLIDEDTIADYLASVACKTYGNPNNPYTPHDYDNDNKSLDLEKAKSLLDAAGWNYDDEIEILCYYTDQPSLDVLEIIKADAAKIGVKMKVNVITENAGVAIYTDKNFDIMFFQGNGKALDPGEGLSNLTKESWTFTYPTSWIPEKYGPLQDAKNAAVPGTEEFTTALHAMIAANQEDMLFIPVYVNATVITYNTAHVYIPETAFDYYDDVLDLHEWKMLH